MTKRLVFGVAWLCLVGAANAQSRPSFSGQWAVPDASAEGRPAVARSGDAAFRGGEMGSGWGSPVTITQRDDSLIVEYVVFSAYDLQPPLRLAYAMDGSESRNRVMLSHAAAEQRSRVTWRDSVLVITTRHAAPGASMGSAGVVEVRQALTLTSPTSLVVETTRDGILGGPTTTTRTVFTKR